MKKCRGITLIALVITIIVLLILAGVSLSLIVGEQGILERATKSVTKTNESSIQEEVQLAYQAILMDDYHNDKENQRAQALEKELQKEDKNASVVEWEEFLIVNYKQYEVTIDKDGTIFIEKLGSEEKPTGEVEILTTEENPEKVRLKVTAHIVNGSIVAIEPLNGAVLKEDTSAEEKIFEVEQNGRYYFRIKGSSNRTTIVSSQEITNITPPYIGKKETQVVEGVTLDFYCVNTEYRDSTGEIKGALYMANGMLGPVGSADWATSSGRSALNAGLVDEDQDGVEDTYGYQLVDTTVRKAYTGIIDQNPFELTEQNFNQLTVYDLDPVTETKDFIFILSLEEAFQNVKYLWDLDCDGENESGDPDFGMSLRSRNAEQNYSCFLTWGGTMTYTNPTHPRRVMRPCYVK